MCGGRGRLWPRGLYSGYVQAMEPKPVDERDTRWEADKAPLRIFIHSPGHTVGAYDTECSLAAAEAWATTHDEAVGYQVALRVDDAREQLRGDRIVKLHHQRHPPGIDDERPRT